MADFPALPLWTDAWVADTKHLSRVERGTYLDLLVLIWRSPGCRVPNDNVWLGKHLAMTVKEVVGELRQIITEFCQSDGNWITQKRLTKESQFLHKQSDSSKARWHKEKTLSQNSALGSCQQEELASYQPQDPSIAIPVSHGISTKKMDATTPTPTPTPLKKKEPPIAPRKSGGVLANDNLSKFVEWYGTYPRHVARGAAEKAFVKALLLVSLETLIAGARGYAQSVIGKEPQYVAHPATWLNQRRWEDEPARAAVNGVSIGRGPTTPAPYKPIGDE